MQQGLAQSKVLDKVLRRQQILAKQLELTAAAVAQITSSQALHEEGWDQYQQRVETHTVQVFKVEDQVRRSHDPSLLSVLPEMVAQNVFDDMLHRDNDSEQATFNAPMESAVSAREMFDDLPRWDDGATQAEQVLFNVVMAPTSATHEFLDDKSLPDAIWDEQSGPNSSLHGLLQHPAHGGERNPATEAFTNDLPHIVVWDDMPASSDGHDGLLEQLAMGNEYMADEKTNENIITNTKLAVSDVPTHFAGLPFLELNVSTAGKVLSDIDKDLCSRPEQMYQPSAAGAQQEGSSMLLLPSNKISDSFGDFEFLELHLPRAQIGKVEQKESPPWRIAFGPGKYRMEVGCVFLSETPSWQQGGFSPWSKVAISQELTKFAENEGVVFFGLSSTRLWDPGVLPYVISWHIMCQMLQDSDKQISNEAFKLSFLIGAYMIYVDCKGAINFVRKLWDPGIWRYIIREMVLEFSIGMIILLSRRWNPSHEPDQLFIKRFSWPLMAPHRDGCAFNILHRMTQAVCCLHIGLAWGQASFSGGGNVMTRIWPGRSPDYQAHLSSHSPSKAHNQDYISAAMDNQGGHRTIKKQKT